VKRAVFPLLSLVFLIVCAVLVYAARESAPSYVDIISTLDERESSRTTGAQSPASQTAEKAALVNINTADLDELMSLHGIGAVIGQRIIDYREDSGAFAVVEELMEVRGIGAAVFERIKDSITV